MFSLVSIVLGLGNHHLLLNVVLIKILLECFFCPYSKLSNCFRFSVKNLMPSRNADVSTRYDFENEQIGQGAVFGHDVCSHRFFYPFLHYNSLQLVWWRLSRFGGFSVWICLQTVNSWLDQSMSFSSEKRCFRLCFCGAWQAATRKKGGKKGSRHGPCKNKCLITFVSFSIIWICLFHEFG